MKKELMITVLLFICCSFAYSQVKKDTIYYDQYWENSTKEKARYYRPSPIKNSKGLYVIKDYFIEGMLQMEGNSKDITGKLLEGKVIWYFKNGKIHTERTYSNGSIEGEVKSFFNDGELITSGIYKKNEPYNGTFLVSEGEYETYSYTDGVLVSENYYYEDTRTIGRKRYYKYSALKSKEIFFNRKGVEIITKYSDYSTVKTAGKVLEVYYTLSVNRNIKEIYFYIEEIENKGVLQQIVKDKNQKILAKGILKDGEPFNGTFLKDRKIINYKKGVKNGEVVFYTKDYKKVAVGIYKDGKEFSGKFYNSYDGQKEIFKNGNIVAKETKNEHTGEEYYCSFEDDTPVSGTYFISKRKLETFKNKKLIKVTKCNFYTGIKENTTFYGKDKYDITKRVYHTKEGESTVIYKNGLPIEGKEITNKGYITYADGEANGPFLITDRKVSIKGNYKKRKKEGEIFYAIESTKDTVSCIFKDDQPMDGTIFEFSKLMSYKNGKKEGCGYQILDYRGYAYDSIQKCYKEGVPKGTKTYYKENKFVTSITYKQGKPFEGTSYKKKYKTIYKEGKKIVHEMPFSGGYYKQQFFNIYNIPIKEVIREDDYRDSIVYTVTYKKGKPFVGTEIFYDSINKVYKETNFLKGKKEGIQNVYTYLDKHFIAQYNYTNDLKEGRAKFKMNPFTDTIYEIIYRKGKPYTGTLIENDNDKGNNYKKTYNKGKIESISYYEYSKDRELASIIFRKEKPYEGLVLEDNEYDKNVKEYNRGNLVATYIEVSDFTSDNKPFRYKTKIYHEALKDSVINTYSKEDYITIIYNSKAKKSGNVNYYLNKEVKGKAKFKNNKLTDLEYSSDFYGKTKIKVNLLNGSLCYELIKEGYRVKFKSDELIINKPYYQFFLEKMKVGSNAFLGDIELYIDASDTPLTTVEMKNEKPYKGIMFRPIGKLFNINIFEKGEVVKEFKKLTKEELLQKVKEFKN